MKREHRQCAHFWNFGGICITVVVKPVLRNLRPKHDTFFFIFPFIGSCHTAVLRQREVGTDFKLELLSLENFLIWKNWKENRWIQRMCKGFQIFLCTPGASGMLGALQVFSRQCSCSTSELILQLSLLQEFFHVNFSSFSSTEKHSQSMSLKTLECLNVSVKQKTPVSNNTLLQTVISVYVTLTCIRILRKPFMVILLIFSVGREHTGSSAFRNCFKLGRVNEPSKLHCAAGG